MVLISHIVADIRGHERKFKFCFLSVDDFNKRFKIILIFSESQFVTSVERNSERLEAMKFVRKYYDNTEKRM